MKWQFSFKDENRKGKKTTCPKCNKSKEFSLYYDLVNGEWTDMGVCNRPDSCGYKKLPTSRTASSTEIKQVVIKEIPQRFVPNWQVEVSMNPKHYSQNAFLVGLAKYFDFNHISNIAYIMGIGTGAGGSTIFFYTDASGKTWNAKRIFYAGIKRNKQIPPKVLFTSSQGYKMYLFGIRCLDASKPLNLVESGKSAFICKLARPNQNWASIEGANMFTLETVKHLLALGFTEVNYYYDSDNAGRLSAIRAVENANLLGLKVNIKSIEVFVDVESGEIVNGKTALNLEVKDGRIIKVSFKDGYTSSKPDGYDVGDLVIDSVCR